jgi:hypothetical protein
MLFKGPGIPKAMKLDFLGTQVDLAPTMLGFAGLDAAPWMDGKSIVALLVKPGDRNTSTSSAADTSSGDDTSTPIPASVLRHLESLKSNSFIRDRSAYTPDGAPVRTASFHEYYNQGPWEVGKTHALDDWSNTYIGLHVVDAR